MLTLIGTLAPYDELALLGSQQSAIPVLSAVVAAGPSILLTWSTAGITSETGYSIRRRDVTSGGSFAEIATVGPDTGTATDNGPFTSGHVYEYQIAVVGGGSNGNLSNAARVFGHGTSGRRRMTARFALRGGP